MRENYFSTELIVDYRVFKGPEFKDLADELEASNDTMRRISREGDEKLFEYLEKEYPEMDFGDYLIIEFYW
jgi:hypothetical protein